MLEFLLPEGLLDGHPLNWYAVVAPNTLRVPAVVGSPHMATDDAVTRIVVMDAFPDGPVSLDYYAADFGYNGGTMHGSRQDALEECDGEFGASLGAWTPIPDDVDNLEQFVLRRVATEFS